MNNTRERPPPSQSADRRGAQQVETRDSPRLRRKQRRRPGPAGRPCTARVRRAHGTDCRWSRPPRALTPAFAPSHALATHRPGRISEGEWMRSHRQVPELSLPCPASACCQPVPPPTLT